MRGVFSVLLLLAPVCEAFTVPRAPHGLMKLARPCRRSVAPSASLDVVDPSYNLALGSLALGAVFGLPPRSVDTLFETIVSRAAYLVGTLCAAFGLFIAFQTTTLRFTFDETSFALVKADLSSTGENVVVGGENVWKYSEFVNYDFFPSESFPILVYFKETQTPKENWNVGPGEQANSAEALAKGAKPGQVHFFPAIARVDAVKAGFQEHNCAKL
uniref:Uncharacterized protein n=1 Tax=Haptolina ericina TaxID=156174 RepID=A0A7S3AHK3_9EUKA|mmetsp:Transcript_1927/g.4322  ORF Transcript_1927/g.4322 Transcript_1927/m.4322 type:complete len:215 (+) Transcript_1927:20-664(+)